MTPKWFACENCKQNQLPSFRFLFYIKISISRFNQIFKSAMPIKIPSPQVLWSLSSLKCDPFYYTESSGILTFAINDIKFTLSSAPNVPISSSGNQLNTSSPSIIKYWLGTSPPHSPATNVIHLAQLRAKNNSKGYALLLRSKSQTVVLSCAIWGRHLIWSMFAGSLFVGNIMLQYFTEPILCHDVYICIWIFKLAIHRCSRTSNGSASQPTVGSSAMATLQCVISLNLSREVRFTSFTIIPISQFPAWKLNTRRIVYSKAKWVLWMISNPPIIIFELYGLTLDKLRSSWFKIVTRIISCSWMN